MNHPGPIFAYGDTRDDGAVQVSFTLPMADGPRATAAALRLAASLNLREVRIAHQESIAGGFTFFVVFGRHREGIDPAALPAEVTPREALSREEIDALIRQRIGRRVVVVGACLESDAHTVGLDAIMSMKGYAGDHGLEAYSEIEAINLGAQVPCEVFVRAIAERRADVALVSQVVTQRGVHLRHLRRLVDLLEAEGLRRRVVLIVGGPAIDAGLARELGFDAAFGRGTTPAQVATFFVRRLIDEGDRG